MNILIVKRPPGEAPDDVRDAWIGLSLPVLPRHARMVESRSFGVLSIPRSWLARRLSRLFRRTNRMRGYPVNTAAAVDLLERTNPRAAGWWRTNAPHLFKPGLCLLFDADCCVVEDPGAVSPELRDA